mgnify:CR=1 FL=1
MLECKSKQGIILFAETKIIYEQHLSTFQIKAIPWFHKNLKSSSNK